MSNGVNVQAAYMNAKMRIEAKMYDYKDEVIVSMWEELRKMVDKVATFRAARDKENDEMVLKMAKLQHRIQILESRDWFATEAKLHDDEAGQVLTRVMQSLPVSNSSSILPGA